MSLQESAGGSPLHIDGMVGKVFTISDLFVERRSALASWAACLTDIGTTAFYRMQKVREVHGCVFGAVAAALRWSGGRHRSGRASSEAGFRLKSVEPEMISKVTDAASRTFPLGAASALVTVGITANVMARFEERPEE